MNAELIKTGKAQKAVAMVGDFRNQINTMQGFAAQQVRLKTSTASLTEEIVKQDMTFSKMFAMMRSGQFGNAVRSIAAEQNRLKNTLLVPETQNALGTRMGATAIVPQGAIQDVSKLKSEVGVLNSFIHSGATQMLNWGKNTQWAGRQLTVGLTLPIVAAAAGMGDLAFKLNDAQSHLRAVYGDGMTSSKQLDSAISDTTNTAKQMAEQFGQSADSTTQLAASFAAAGYKGQALQDITKETTRIMTLGETDQQTAMQATISLMNTFKLRASDLHDVFNHMNAVENQTVLTTQDMVTAIPRVAPIIAQLNGNYKDMLVLLTAMKAGGIDATAGATALSRGLTSLLSTSSKASADLQQLNINIAQIFKQNTDSSGQRNIIGIFTDLANEIFTKLGPNGAQKVIVDLFGKFQTPRITAMLRNLADGAGKVGSQVNQALGAVNASAEDAQKMADQEINQRMNSLSGQLRRAVAMIKFDLAAAGKPFLNVALWILKRIKDIIDMFSHLPGPVKAAIETMLGIAAVVGPIIMLTGLMVNLGAQILLMGSKLIKTATGWTTYTAEQHLANIAGKQTMENFALQQESVEALTARVQELTGQLLGLADAERTVATATADATAANESSAVMPTMFRRPALKETVPAVNSGAGYYGPMLAGYEKVGTQLDKVDQETASVTSKTNGFKAALGGVALTTTKIFTGFMLWNSGLKGIPGEIAKIGGALLILGPVIKGIGGLLTKTLGASTMGKLATGIRSKLGGGTVGNLVAKGVGLGAVGGAGEGIGFGAAAAAAAPVAIAAAGIATLGAGIYVIAKHYHDIYKNQLNVISSAQSLSESVGGAWSTADNWVEKYNSDVNATQTSQKTLTDNANAWKDANEGAYNALKDAASQGDTSVVKYVQNLVQQMHLAGQSVKTIKSAVQLALHSIGKDIGPNSLLDQIVIKPKIDLTAAAQNQAKKAGVQFGKELNNGVLDQTSGIEDALANKFADYSKTLSPKQLTNAVKTLTAPWQTMKENAIKQIEALGPEAVKAMEKFGPTLSTAIDKYLSLPAGTQGNISDSVDPIIQSLQTGSENSDRFATTLGKALGVVNAAGDPVHTLSGLLWGLEHEAKKAADNSNAAGDAIKGMGQNANTAMSQVGSLSSNMQTMVSNFQSVMQTRISEYIDMGLQNFDTATQAHETALDNQQKAEEARMSKRQKAVDAHYSNLIQATTSSNDKIYQSTKDSYDKQIKAIKDKQAAEDAAAKAEQRNFDAEKQRLADEATNQNAALQYNADLAQGNTSQAAIDAANAISTSQQQVLDEAEQARQDQVAADDAANQKRIARLTKEKTAALNDIKAQEDARKKALEHEKRMADEEFAHRKAVLEKETAAEKTAYEQRRAALRAHLSAELNAQAQYAVTNKAQYKKMYDTLNSLLADAGVNVSKEAYQWQNDITGGFKSGIKDAATQVAQDAEWKTLGQKMSEDITQGALGMHWKQFVHWVNTGERPNKHNSNDSSGGSSSDGSTPAGAHRRAGPGGTHHTGAYVHGDGTFENGKMPNEADRRLQEGEVVIQRHAVRKYGPENLMKLNDMRIPKMHEGGMVGEGAIGGAFGNFAMTMKNALYEAIVGSAERRDTKNVKHGLPSIFGPKGGMMSGSMSTLEAELIKFAKSLLGIPYVWGGTTPLGFDCSGFTEYVYKHAIGMQIPRTSQEQYAAARKIQAQNAQAGDLLFTEMGPGGPGHVMMYMGGNRAIEAPHTGANVEIIAMPPGSADAVGRFLSPRQIAPTGGPGGSPGAPRALKAYIPAITRALSTAHLSTSPDYVNAVLHRMGVEDPSGIKGEVNRWDSNWDAGTPSVGLMQVTGPTFKDNAGPYINTGPFSWGVSTNPTANIYAGIEHALHAYSKPFLDVMYQPGGYDNGGWLKPGFTGMINKTGVPEPVFNPAQWDLIRKSVNNQVANGSGNQYNIKVEVPDSNASPELIARTVMNEIQKREGAKGLSRKIGSDA